MTRPVKQRSDLGDLTKIGWGGQGVVYRASRVRTKFSASLVYKQYKPEHRDQIDFRVLAEMPALVENSLSYADGERLVSLAAWPCEMVEDQGTPTGFLMPEIPDQFFLSLTTMRGISRNRAEFQHLLNDESILNARGIIIDDVERYRLLREVASGLVFLHSHGVCVGDISPNNLLFSLKPRESVYFIDCDSMCINGVSALTQFETPGWQVPPGEDPATIYSDTYKLGLLALRLLAGDQDIRDVNDLPPSTPTMMRRIITDTLRVEPQKRPLPEVWTYQLGYAIEEAQHRKASQPADPPPKRAPPTSPKGPPAKAISAAPAPPKGATGPSTSAQGPSGKALAIAVGVALAALMLILIVMIVADTSNSGTVSSSSSSTSSSVSSGDGVTASETDAPTGGTTAAPGVNPQQQSTYQVLPDADNHGFASYPDARCLDIDTAAAIGRTSDSLVVVCQTPSGQLYYRGFGLQNNMAVSINNVVSNGTGFVAYNNGYQYTVSRNALVIADGSSPVSSEPMAEYWPP